MTKDQKDKVRRWIADRLDRMRLCPAQVFTTPDCKVFKAADGYISVQVWVTLPKGADYDTAE